MRDEQICPRQVLLPALLSGAPRAELSTAMLADLVGGLASVERLFGGFPAGVSSSLR